VSHKEREEKFNHEWQINRTKEEDQLGDKNSSREVLIDSNDLSIIQKR